MPIPKGRLYKKCQNYEVQGICNWMIPPEHVP